MDKQMTEAPLNTPRTRDEGRPRFTTLRPPITKRRFITGFPASDQDDGREMRGKDGVMGRNVGHLSEPLVTSTGCNARRPPSNPQEVSPSPVPPRYTGTRHMVRRSEGHRRCEGSISGVSALVASPPPHRISGAEVSCRPVFAAGFWGISVQILG